MMEDFFTRALIAGIGVAAVTGPLGCFVVWRRMAYFGDTMAHSGLLGVALALMLQIDLTVGVFAVAAAVSLAMLALERAPGLSTDSVLGILSHSALAAGIVLIALMDFTRIDLHGLLFGDILAASKTDIATVYVGGALVLAALAVIWRSLLAGTVSSEIAEAEGLGSGRVRIAFMLIMALVIALAMKVTGVILLTSLLIIPAATARRFVATPEAMAVLAAFLGMLAVVAGLYGSLHFDTPSGPSIVLAAIMLFLAGLGATALRRSYLFGSGGDDHG
ncbi:MAG: metal ABC transporter permease [Rhizobiaceae bacterium]